MRSETHKLVIQIKIERAFHIHKFQVKRKKTRDFNIWFSRGTFCWYATKIIKLSATPKQKELSKTPIPRKAQEKPVIPIT